MGGNMPLGGDAAVWGSHEPPLTWPRVVFHTPPLGMSRSPMFMFMSMFMFSPMLRSKLFDVGKVG
jgi:hypothetical protein